MTREIKAAILIAAIAIAALVLFPLFIGGWLAEADDVPAWMNKPAMSLTGQPSNIAMYTGGAHNWLSFMLDDLECAWLTRDLCIELGIETQIADRGWVIDATLAEAHDALEAGGTVTVWGWWRPEYFVVVEVVRVE